MELTLVIPLTSARVREHKSGDHVAIEPQSCSVPASNRYSPDHVRNMHVRHPRKNWTGQFVKHKHLPRISSRTANVFRNFRRCALTKTESFTFIHPTLALSENGAEFGNCYLGTFILITVALSYCCLVTNTFEIDLLTYYEILWKDLRVNSLMEK